MGYETHITRRREWFDDEGPIISFAEWMAYLESDPSMRHDGHAEATTPTGDVIRVESPGLAVWVDYSGHGARGTMAWFDHDDGSGAIVVKGADVEIRAKMYEIATALEAKVQGDEGEEYGPTGSELDARSRDRASRSPWWRFWR